MRELLLEARYLVEDYPSVGLYLCLAGASHSDTAPLALQVGPHAGKAWQKILVLRELHLGSRRGSLRPLGEDVENQAGAVENLDLELLLDVGHLLRAQLIVENHQADPHISISRRAYPCRRMCAD